MKVKITGLLAWVGFVCLASSCGESGPCEDSPTLGAWKNAGSQETITLGAQCTFTSDLCASSGTISNVATAAGTATVNITSGGNPGCLSVGEHSCSYVVQNGTQLSFTCGGSGTLVYQKQ